MFELSLTLLISTFCHHVLSKVCMDHSFEPSELTKYGEDIVHARCCGWMTACGLTAVDD